MPGSIASHSFEENMNADIDCKVKKPINDAKCLLELVLKTFKYGDHGMQKRNLTCERRTTGPSKANHTLEKNS